MAGKQPKPKNAKYIVRLAADERQQLHGLIRTGQRAASVLTRARILLKADAGPDGPSLADEDVARAVETSPSTGPARRSSNRASTPPCTAKSRPAGSTTSSTARKRRS